MESLVCDLSNALKNANNKKKPNHKKLSNLLNNKLKRHNSLNSFKSTSSSSLSRSKASSNLNKHKNIMNLLLAARASIKHLNKSKEKSECDLHKLVRISQNSFVINKPNSNKKKISNISKIKSKRLRRDKEKRVFKLEKIYKFHSNYKLHCIKLRRLQKKFRINNLKQNTELKINQNGNDEKMSMTQSSSNSSTITTSSSNSSYTSTSDLESSSLGECFDMENLNLSSESEFKIKKPKLASKQSPSTSSNKRKLLTYRQRRQLQNHQQNNFLLNLDTKLTSKKTSCFKRKRVLNHYRLSSKKVNKINSTKTNRTDYEESNDDKETIESEPDLEMIKKNQENTFNELNNSNYLISNKQEADDEQSSDSSLKNNPEFDIIPWWNNSNFNLDQTEENEFKTILTGALNLMSENSKINFQSKINNLKNAKRFNVKKRTLSTKNDDESIDFVTPIPVNGEPIPESNIGNKILKNMGWQPGTSLGPVQKDSNLKEPIIALKRPKRVGLGFGSGLN